MFVVVVDISNINNKKNVSYNLSLLTDTNKAHNTKVYSEFSRHKQVCICISKFCFHFLKEVMCFSKVLPCDNLDIKATECTDH